MRRLLIITGMLFLAAASAGLLWAAQAAAERDAQRVRDLQAIRAQVTGTGGLPPPAVPEAAPRPVHADRPYVYAARDDVFMACTTFERTDSTRALFVTAAGEFRAARQYCQASFDPRIAAIVTDARLTDAGIGPFLAAAPELADAPTVKDRCQTAGPNEVLFGCFLPANKIWLLDVKDPDLPNLATVAAVHELLHALESVDPLPADQVRTAAERLADPQLAAELAIYDESERDSELGARLGTEYGGLPAELETYYSRYFDRPAVVARYATYGQLVREVNALRGRIESEQTRLDRLRASGQIADYNAGVDDYNALVRRYNALADRYNLVGE